MHTITLDFLKELEQKTCFYLLNQPMSEYTSFKIGGPADILIEPANLAQLTECIVLCSAYKVPFVVIGNGSNILVSDKGIRGAVIHLGSRYSELKLVDDNRIYASAGVSLSKLASFAMENALTGLEFAFGIPGNVGGAIFMNAGAYGGEMKTTIETIEHIDIALQTGKFIPIEAEMNYRHSIYHENGYLITGGYFLLESADKTEIKTKMTDFLMQRKTKQPLELPSGGSTFTRPKDAYAAALIDQCGLKGRAVGGAMVSTKHAGFVVNTGNATRKDVLALVEIVKAAVLEKTGVLLELEIRLIGEIDK